MIIDSQASYDAVAAIYRDLSALADRLGPCAAAAEDRLVEVQTSGCAETDAVVGALTDIINGLTDVATALTGAVSDVLHAMRTWESRNEPTDADNLAWHHGRVT